MANKRMIAKQIIDSDAFLDMPLTTQALYLHLNFRADDDGFVNNPKKIMRMIGSNEDEMKVLLGKKFVIAFESGIIVIKHWRIHNTIQKDRYKPTVYQKEFSKLSLKDNNGYTLDTECIQNDNTDKIRLDKIRKEKKSIKEIIKEKNLPNFDQVRSLFVEYLIKLFSSGTQFKEDKIDSEARKFYRHFVGDEDVNHRGKWIMARSKKHNAKLAVKNWVDSNPNMYLDNRITETKIKISNWTDLENKLRADLSGKGIHLGNLFQYLKNNDNSGYYKDKDLSDIYNIGIKNAYKFKI